MIIIHYVDYIPLRLVDKKEGDQATINPSDNVQLTFEIEHKPFDLPNMDFGHSLFTDPLSKFLPFPDSLYYSISNASFYLKTISFKGTEQSSELPIDIDRSKSILLMIKDGNFPVDSTSFFDLIRMIDEEELRKSLEDEDNTAS